MNILILTPRYAPESFSIAPLAESLKNLGNTITVVTGRPSYGKNTIYEGYENTKEEYINGIHVIRVNEHIRKKSLFSLILNYFSLYIGFRKYLKKYAINNLPDIILTHTISPIYALCYVPKFVKKFKIPHVHYGLDLWPESLIATGTCRRWSPLFLITKNISRKIYNSSKKICFASPCAELYFRDYLKIKTPFKQIYQPCLTRVPNLNFSNADIKTNKIRHILFCGTVAKFNHLDLMIKAMSVNKDNDKFVFDIVGSGSELEKLKKLVCKLKLTNVIFHGRVSPDETINYYNNADVLFVPLFWNSKTSEMIPQKLIEYFMYGKLIFGMIKGDGMDMLIQASKRNVVVDQTIESISLGLSKLINVSCADLRQCGVDNRQYFNSNERFLLSTISRELNDVLIECKNDKKFN